VERNKKRFKKELRDVNVKLVLCIEIESNYY
jgi:hypothetical protein